MNLARTSDNCVCSGAADSVDEMFYRNLIGRSFGVIDAFADNSCL